MFRVFSLLAPEIPTTDGKLASTSHRIAFFCTVFYCYYLEVVFLLLKGLDYLQRQRYMLQTVDLLEEISLSHRYSLKFQLLKHIHKTYIYIKHIRFG